MKRLMILLPLAVVLVSACAHASWPPPPDVREGLSMVSFPCGVDLNAVRQATDQVAFNVYDWTGEQYAAAESIVPGRGYFLDANAAPDLAKFCTSEPTSEDLTITLRKGWNLIGTPFPVGTTIRQALIGVDPDDVEEMLYTFVDGRIFELSKDEWFVPWRGYWVYATEPVSVTFQRFPFHCNELSMRRVLPGEEGVFVGDTVVLDVTCRTDTEEHNITKDAVWTHDNPVVLGPGSRAGEFTATATGTTNVTAMYGYISTQIAVDVIEGMPIQRDLVLTIDKPVIEMHQTSALKVTMTDDNGERIVTPDVAWKISDADAVTIVQSTGNIYPNKPGTIILQATLGNLKSNEIAMTISPKTMRWIRPFSHGGAITQQHCPENVRGSSEKVECYTHFAMLLGATGRMEAMNNWDVYGETTTGQMKILGDYDLTWDISDTSILQEGYHGEFKALSEGAVQLRAFSDGISSEPMWVYVYSDTTDKFVLLEFSNRPTIVEKGNSIDVGATVYTVRHSQYYSSISSEYMPAGMTFELSDPTVGHIASGEFHGDKAGITNITAVYNGVRSNTVALKVWETTHIDPCNEREPNEAIWYDGLTLVSLETDCKVYGQGDKVKIQFLGEMQPTNRRDILDVCLDLYIYDDQQNLVRTFRQENCGSTALFRSHDGFNTVYNYIAEWDQQDNDGNSARPGAYTAVARFYLLYCPVIRVPFEIR